MPQALYLDEKILSVVEKAAKEAGVSVELWLQEAIQHKLLAWNPSVRELAGAWKDFPTREELGDQGQDLPREPL